MNKKLDSVLTRLKIGHRRLPHECILSRKTLLSPEHCGEDVSFAIEHVLTDLFILTKGYEEFSEFIQKL